MFHFSTDEAAQCLDSFERYSWSRLFNYEQFFQKADYYSTKKKLFCWHEQRESIYTLSLTIHLTSRCSVFFFANERNSEQSTQRVREDDKINVHSSVMCHLSICSMNFVFRGGVWRTIRRAAKTTVAAKTTSQICIFNEQKQFLHVLHALHASHVQAK